MNQRSGSARFVCQSTVLACLVAACGGTPVTTLVPDPVPSESPVPRASGARPAAGSSHQAGTTSAPEALVVPRAVLDRVLAAGPGRLLADVPLEPVLGPGRRFEGFRIVDLFHGDARVQRFGVRPGDVVHAVNGQRIVTPGDLLKIFERLKGAEMLEVTLQREGTIRTLRLPIEPMATPAVEPRPGTAVESAPSTPGS